MENPKVDNVGSISRITESEAVLRKPRVLIVEDDKGINRLLHAALGEDAQAEERSYESAGEAVTMLEQRPDGDPEIDLLITDLGLIDGGTAGTRVIEAFRKKYPKSSIVCFTGDKSRIDGLYTPEQRKELDFDVWEKPLNFVKLHEKINTIKESINKPPQA